MGKGAGGTRQFAGTNPSIVELERETSPT